MRPAASPVPFARAVAFLGCVVLGGCGGGAVPDPRTAAEAYARAAASGDDRALHAMLTSASRETHSAADTKRLVTEQRTELAAHAKEVVAPTARVVASARVRFEDGEEAHLDLHDGRFEVSAAGTLPGGARTPEQALEQLRRAIARRSYAALMRVLSPATRAAIEQDLKSLVLGLERPDTLRVQVTGDAANVDVPGGHLVKLKRDAGVWRIDDFD